MAAGLEADAVDGGVDLAGPAQELLESAPNVVGFGESMVSQPKLAAWRRSAFMSATMTTAAPSRWAEVAQASPTGPAPATYTVEPVVTPAVQAPW